MKKPIKFTARHVKIILDARLSLMLLTTNGRQTYRI